MDMQHGDIDMKNRHTARTCRMNMQEEHATRTCSMEMQHEQAGWTGSMETGTWSIDVKH
jgi:hypothetical protein